MRRSQITLLKSNRPVSSGASTPVVRRQRRGFLSAELIFTLPILAIVLFGLFEFSMLFFARGQVAEAARVGCRKATLPGVQAVDVEETVIGFSSNGTVCSSTRTFSLRTSIT